KAAGSKKKRKRNPTEEEIMARLARKRAKQNRELESRVLSQKLAEHGLSLVEIPADGHCLFAAISDQLKRSARHGEVIHNYKSLRRLACDYMLKHEDHFKHFLSLGKDTFEEYCKRIGRTTAWGGQHEIIALCHALKRNIEVYRHDMTRQLFPDAEAPYEGPPLRLSYHMHEYSGGEHYNSVVP
ncbi:hypothetical protein GUITHDRAFT_46351, partial [Guillardia theta CCMP2712]